ncbi:hypothetical protein KKE19_00910 [Patescibacteria group bacterium]|nr:hypothetical protein [Patescibacteria group bacterium]MBU4274354.1 hypothetical protein [Patescibacteria group bacterium]MBU4367538.1 hypothetical protein [Patescibacteria group bacterium]MBU4461579.1 hypothetical protein [Patescibacteria group bacterium]MCG2699476.1 hypothetical protein [Candidatus Parcubacteria bacterium]
MKKIIKKFLITVIIELIPWIGGLIPAWSISVFTQLKSEGNLTAPESVIMLPMAFLIDLMGFLLLIFGLDDIGLLDFIGSALIGGWLLIRNSMKSMAES